MGALEGRIAIITGAGRGMGREHALLFAREGANVVVNDNGCELDGTDAAEPVAAKVADEIKALGGTAIANTEDVADFAGARRLIDVAVENFGRLDVLVNNASILRDRMIWEMSEEDWDLLQRNNLKAVFAPLRWASVHWKERSEAGDAVNGAVINISSMSGLNGMPGQSNYTAAKAGVAALTVATSRELARFGVRVNGILPEARTRMSLGVFEHFPDQQMFREIISSMFPPGEAPAGIMEVDRMELADLLKPGDTGHPARVSPAVAYLATADCPLTGQLIEAGGTKPISVMESWRHGESFANDGAWWTIDEVAACLSTVGREAKV